MKRSYYEFYVLDYILKGYCYIIFRKYLFLPCLFTLDPGAEITLDNTKLTQVQNALEKWLKLLQKRPDVLGSPEFQDFLYIHLPGVVDLRICKEPYLKFSTDMNFGEFRISDILICESIGLVVCAHEDCEAINKVGVIWNIVDTNTFGYLTFWKYNPSASESLERICKLDFEQRITKLLTDKDSKIFIVGTDDGELHIITREFVLENRSLSESHYRNKIVSARIVGLSWLIEGKIIALIGANNFLKLFDTSSLKVVGGGSLNKRLSGTILTSMEVDQSKCRIFFGTNKGIIMCYQINPSDYKPSFLYNITLGEGKLAGLSIGSLICAYGNIFASCGTQILAYDVSSPSEPKTVI